ncbi:hypothetical protein CC78DRAFT_465656 [Lojkania enalia]|uniref:Zn(2)-C6 fungal-type domain-containing protein n=1 Tax=Lojkania enalia TaxID=147567 RepID=A0A9P4K5R7_9PLEO|nr:hypothetical protein CC78DRAFT_465656 [Didymosphaeria enalia]
MAETVAIPSPSLFLNSSDPSPAQTPVAGGSKRPQQQASKDVSRPSDSNGITKRKQSKSRNGCITCKAKRLKCDETKPSCQQCARRNVTCGGYKKDFKWRPFEEASFVSKPPGKSKKVPSPPTSAPLPSPSQAEDFAASDASYHPIANDHSLHHAHFAPPRSPGAAVHGLPPASSFIESPYPPVGDVYSMSQPSPFIMAPSAVPPVDQFAPASVESSSSMFEAESVDSKPTKTTAPSSISSGQSPRLVDLLLPGTDLSVPPEEYLEFRSQYPESFYLAPGMSPAEHQASRGFSPPLGAPGTVEEMDEDDVEDIPRTFYPDRSPWVIRLPSPTPSSSSSSSSESVEFPILMQPQFSTTSPEMLTRRFDRDTCGILSVKDGPTENPWRTLLWPLARDCPALYHAIASMTSFHQSRDCPALRIQGIDHMRLSVRALASNLKNMRVDAAISTTLVLAFSESWDQHISTGINHIKGAKTMIHNALTQHKRVPLRGDEYSRLKFLCNSWIYIDVIARLTSSDDDESDDFDVVSSALNAGGETDASLDPLMGCASTLFPIIGRVANLVKKVRRTDSNGPTIVSQAMTLKHQLEEWVPPSFIEDPEDETTSPHDSIKTAIAYQYSTLLYLHQAVPEIPSLPSAVLAKRVLCELATVHPSSRAVIVQIYPLMAAGCESMDEDDRAWVQDRWDSMAVRMKLGIIEKSLEVTKEVWNRRDAYTAETIANGYECNGSVSPISLKRDFTSISEEVDLNDPFSWLEGGNKRRALSIPSLFDSPQATTIKYERKDSNRRVERETELLDPEFTVRGRLHWLGVMKDWGWEGE